jgi:hypothetical protein
LITLPLILPVVEASDASSGEGELWLWAGAGNEIKSKKKTNAMRKVFGADLIVGISIQRQSS